MSKERFTIDNDAGTPVFEVHKIYGLTGNSLSLRSPGGGQLALIEPGNSPTRFEISAEGHPPTTVRHHGWFGRRYDIQTPTSQMTATVSDFSKASYDLTSLGTVVATVSRPFIRQQSLTIEITESANAVALIAVVLAIETLRDDRRQAQDAIPYVRLLLRLVN
jgi:uncharacterized protein YxjI